MKYERIAICKICGEEYTKKSHNSKYCDKCRKQANIQKVAECHKKAKEKKIPNWVVNVRLDEKIKKNK